MPKVVAVAEALLDLAMAVWLELDLLVAMAATEITAWLVPVESTVVAATSAAIRLPHSGVATVLKIAMLVAVAAEEKSAVSLVEVVVIAADAAVVLPEPLVTQAADAAKDASATQRADAAVAAEALADSAEGCSANTKVVDAAAAAASADCSASSVAIVAEVCSASARAVATSTLRSYRTQ